MSAKISWKKPKGQLNILQNYVNKYGYSMQTLELANKEINRRFSIDRTADAASWAYRNYFNSNPLNRKTRAAKTAATETTVQTTLFDETPAVENVTVTIPIVNGEVQLADVLVAIGTALKNNG